MPKLSLILTLINSIFLFLIFYWIVNKNCLGCQQEKPLIRLFKAKLKIVKGININMTKKLQRQIEKKLEKLSQLLDNIDEVRVIEPTDPDTWDSDALYNLAEQLKEALALLEDQESNQRDEYGEPLILEAGICSLVDDYQANQEEEA